MEPHSWPRLGRFASAGSIVIALGACAAPLVAPDAGFEVAQAIASTGAIELRVEGDPVDAAGPGTAQLGLAEAISLAVERDARLQAALARVRVALADAEQARLLPNPILSLVLRFPQGGGRADVEAGLTAELASILTRPRRTSAADSRLRAAAADAVVVALDVVADARERYAHAQAQDELLPLLRERAALVDRLVELAESRLELGEAGRSDVTAIRTRRVELEIEISDVELRGRQARLALSRAIGEPSGAAAWGLDDWTSIPEQLPEEATWMATALQRRPEIHSALLELAALGDEAALAALTLWDGSSLGLRAERAPDWSVGPELALPIPLFDNGDTRRARASAEIAAARHALVDLSRDVIEAVRQAYTELRGVQRNLERVHDDLIPLQQRRREDIETIYLAGHADVTAVLLAEQDLQATQSKLVELEERAAIALARLERAVGGPAAARDVIDAATDAANPRPSTEPR